MTCKICIFCLLMTLILNTACNGTMLPEATESGAAVPTGSTRAPTLVELSNLLNADLPKMSHNANATSGTQGNPASQVDIIFNSGGPSSAGFSMEAMRESMERNFENMFLMSQLRGMGGMGGGMGGGMAGGMGGGMGAMGMGSMGGGGMGMNNMGFGGMGGMGAMAGMLPFMSLRDGRAPANANAEGTPRSAAFHAGFGNPNMNPFASMMGMGIPPSMMMRSMIGAGAGNGMGLPGLNALAAAAAMPASGAEPVVTGAGTGATTDQPAHCPKWARMFCGSMECSRDIEWIPFQQCRAQMGIPMCRCLVGPSLVKCCNLMGS